MWTWGCATGGGLQSNGWMGGRLDGNGPMHTVTRHGPRRRVNGTIRGRGFRCRDGQRGAIGVRFGPGQAWTQKRPDR